MLRESLYVKIRVTVPLSHAEAVREVLGKNGAGEQGKYIFCSGSYRMTGRFMPQVGANPAIGMVGAFEEVDEEMIEVICHTEKVKTVIDAVRAVHPYEEPAIDIVPRFEVD
mgnify:CR=1 FL=1